VKEGRKTVKTMFKKKDADQLTERIESAETEIVSLTHL